VSLQIYFVENSKEFLIAAGKMIGFTVYLTEKTSQFVVKLEVAMKEGCFCGIAPFGYDNWRNEDGSSQFTSRITETTASVNGGQKEANYRTCWSRRF